jgi:hypothetical protein
MGVQGVQVWIPLLKHHTAPLYLLPLKKKKLNRMNQINRHYNSKLDQVGYCHLILGSAEYMILQGVPEERRIVKCHTYITAPFHLALSYCFCRSYHTAGGEEYLILSPLLRHA